MFYCGFIMVCDMGGVNKIIVDVFKEGFIEGFCFF